MLPTEYLHGRGVTLVVCRLVRTGSALQGIALILCSSSSFLESPAGGTCLLLLFHLPVTV